MDTMEHLLPRLFLEQARQCPDAPAVIHDGGAVTYGELDRSARRIAGALAARGIGAESTVGVLIAPGPDLVACLLGIWLAGGCYLPLDALAPARRLRQVLDLSGAALVLADRPWPGGDQDLPSGVRLCSPRDLAAADHPAPPQIGRTRPGQAAYLIFTSGSTGTPKGVVIEHEGIANRVRWAVRALELGPADRVLQKTPLTFDAAGWEIFAPLICGAPVTFGSPEAGRDPGELVRSLRERGATVVQVVPTMLRLLAAEPDLDTCTSLRLVCSAGEQLQAELCHSVLDQVAVGIWNTYGPTECAIDFLAARFDPAQRSGPVPIGRPIDNARYLLDPADADAAAGTDPVYELYACGPGVGRGYHGDPAQTAERFLPDASGPPGSRMYRTGDLVRTRADGALEFVGRVDGQLKVNGVRIEPGEVEAVLTAHPDVVEAAVRAVTDPHGTRRLAAWVVARRAGAIEDLLPYLRDRLPSAMVPAIVTGLEALPRTTSGKTDRARLPEPAWAAPGGADRSEAQAPYTAEERIVLATWRDLLAVDEIGLDDDFFRLGGHSLLLTKLAARLTEASGLGLDFRDLHYAATAREQARLLADAVRAQPIERLADGARRPLSHAQERFWVLDRMNPGSREYLLPILIWLPSDVAPETVGQALALLVSRHEVLRTRYTMDAEGLAAVVEPTATIPLQVAETSAARMYKFAAQELAEGFDLGAAPLCRGALLRDGGEEQLLLLVCHHIVSDGWSARLMEQDLRELVAAIREERDPRLAPVALRYTDAAAWQRTQLTDELLAGHLDYWRETLADLPDLGLPTLAERDAHRGIEGGAAGLDLPADTVAALLAAGRDVGATPFVTFLTLWTVLLARAGERWDFGVGSAHAGRSRPELHDVVGLFINVVVIRSRLTPDLTFTEALARVGRACREGFAHHAAPFEAVAQAAAPGRDLSKTPLFQALFTMTGDDLVGQRTRERNVELLGRVWSMARTDLTLTLWPHQDGGYGGALEYASALYDQRTADLLTARLRTLADRFAADPDLPIGSPEADKPQDAPGPEPDLAPHQETILRFVRDLLKQEDVGFEESVMERGGNSLMAARLLWNVQSAFGVEVSMHAFFDRPTAAGLADAVEQLIRDEFDGPGPQAESPAKEDAR
jgi:amino acid adenylation domain-containing protein